MNRPKSKANIKKLIHNSSSDTDDDTAASVADIKNKKCDINDGTYTPVKLTAADVKARTRLQPRRTKLDSFVYKRPPPSNNTNNNSSNNDESDFETPEKKRMPQAALTIKPTKHGPRQQNAQKRKPSEKGKRREKKQPSIKSALLRNEMFFSDIVAQHTIADNFNPDEMQLALALSKSEAELKHVKNPQKQKDQEETVVENENDKIKNIRDQLERYGFRTGTRADYENMAIAFKASENSKRHKKCKWADKITPLTLRNAELQANKLQQNINKILMYHEHGKKTATTTTNDNEGNLLSNNVTISVYTPVSCVLKQLLESSLPAITTRDDKSMTISSSQQMEKYFVKDLFEVSHLRAGYLLKNWSSIQGREVSPDAKERRPKFEEQKPMKAKAVEEADLEEIQEKQAVTRMGVEQNIEHMLLDDLGEQSLSQKVQTQDENNIDSDDSATYIRVHSPDIFGNSLCESPEHVHAAADNDTCKEYKESEKCMHENPTEIMNNIIAYEINTSDDEDISTENVDTPLVDLTQCEDQEEKKDTECLLDLTPCNAVNSRMSVEEEDEQPQELAAIEYDKEEVEVKESSLKVTTPCILDLTQCEAESSEIYVISSNEAEKKEEEELQPQEELATEEKNDIEKEEKEIFISPKNKRLKLNSSFYTDDGLMLRKSIRKTLNTSCDNFQKYSSLNTLDVSCNRKSTSMGDLKDNSLSAATESIDLTQSINESENNDEDDDDVILLSDDEINYSTIKSKSFKATKRRATILHNQLQAQEKVNDVNFDEEEDYDDYDEDGLNTNNNNFSMLDILADFGACENNQEENDDKVIMPQEPPGNNAPKLNDSLEEALAVAAALEDDSYLMSMSSTESTAPMKRFSMGKNNEKFTKLLSNVILDEQKNEKHKSDNDDFDEFDALVYQANNIETTTTSTIKKPSGLEQLLTAEIRTNPLKDTCTITTQEIEETLDKPVEIPLTPPCQEVNVNGITYLVRESHTPEPTYEDWNDDKLVNKLNEYGIKPLKRYQAIKLLDYIYRSTHPIVLDDNDDDDDDHVNVYDDNTKRSHLAKNIQLPKLTNTKNTLTNLPLINNNNENDNNKYMLGLSDNCSGNILLKNYNSYWDTLLEGEEYIFQTNITKKTQQPLLPLHKAWSNLVASSTTLHERLLMYEPIDLECIYLYFKSINYRYDPKHIREFFDKRCIIFSYESPTPKQSGGGSQKPRVGRQKSSNKMLTKKRI